MGDEAEQKLPDKCGEPTPDRDPETGTFLPGNSQAFKAGRDWTGNAAGRPKHKTLTEELVKMLDKPATSLNFMAKVARALGVDPGELTVREVLVLSSLAHGTKGQPAILNALWDRVDGKVAERIAGHDGGPLVVQQTLDRVLGDPDAMRAARDLANKMSEAQGQGDAGGTDDGSDPRNE